MAYPKSSERKIKKLTSLLVNYAEQNDVRFCLGEEPIYAVETFSDFGGLSLFLLEAKDMYEKIFNNIYTVEELMQPFGKKIKQLSIEETIQEQDYLDKQPKDKIFPIIFEEKDDTTYFGFIPKIGSEQDGDFFMLAHFTYYIVEEYVNKYKSNKVLLIDGMVPLDALYEKLVNKVNANKIDIAPKVKSNEKENNAQQGVNN